MTKTIATTCPIISCACQVVKVSPLAANAFLVELQAPANTRLTYHAGQYLQLEIDVHRNGEYQSLCYSIANRFDPQRPRRLQLIIHISSDLSNGVLQRLKSLQLNNETLLVRLPMGRAFIQTPLDSSHVLIAAGSGISKIKCLSEEILHRNPEANLTLYWSNKQLTDFYWLDQFQDWETQHGNFRFRPILEAPDSTWDGRTGYIYEVVTAEHEYLNDTAFYLCGSPRMVYGTIDQLKALGLTESNCYSDVFEYAPRGQPLAV